ncbi:blastula protease 10-like [Glandiceps talaboti]
MAFPSSRKDNQTGKAVPEKDNFDPTKKETVFSDNTVEGDMRLSGIQKEVYEELTITKGEKNDSVKPKVEEAMATWESHTCIQFVDFSSSGVTHQGKLSLIEGNGCWSDVAFINGTQETSLSVNGCKSTRVATHELGHIIGLWHEHTRPDRDTYITVNEENIETGEASNFEMKDWSAVDVHDVPYDVSSIMHYGPKAYSKDSTNTITAVDPLDQSSMGLQLELSHLDHKIVNLMYGCSDHCTSPPTCSCGGYVGKDCTCLCPYGFTGPTCDDLTTQPDCGGRIMVTSSGTLTSPGYPSKYGNNRECHWFLEAAEGSIISVTFDDFLVEAGGSSCPFDRVEIRHVAPYYDGHPASTITNLISIMCVLFHRWCSSLLDGQSVKSVYNTMFISLFSDSSVSYKGFTATYTLI